MNKRALYFTLALALTISAVQAKPAVQPNAKATRCEPLTGSRLHRTPKPDGRCETEGALQRSYSREDLERSGAQNPGDALQQLDPSLAMPRVY